MARRRLNDTTALTASPASGGSMDHTICSRKIDNGYIVRTSNFNSDTGEYKCSETFSKDPPRVLPGRVAYSKPGNESLGDTMEYLRDDQTRTASGRPAGRSGY